MISSNFRDRIFTSKERQKKDFFGGGGIRANDNPREGTFNLLQFREKLRKNIIGNKIEILSFIGGTGDKSSRQSIDTTSLKTDKALICMGKDRQDKGKFYTFRGVQDPSTPQIGSKYKPSQDLEKLSSIKNWNKHWPDQEIGSNKEFKVNNFFKATKLERGKDKIFDIDGYFKQSKTSRPKPTVFNGLESKLPQAS